MARIFIAANYREKSLISTWREQCAEIIDLHFERVKRYLQASYIPNCNHPDLEIRKSVMSWANPEFRKE
jgi:hypothetical protein